MYFNGTKLSLFILFTIISLSAKAIKTPIATVSGHCEGQTIYLYANPDTVAPGITYFWTGPGGFSSNAQNPVIFFAATTDIGYYYVYDVIGGIPSAVDSIYVDVQPVTPVSVAITASPNDTVCLGTNVTFTATTITGGLTPTYQWVVDGTPVVGAVYSTWATSTLTDGDVVYCILNSTVNCPDPSPTNSNSIAMNMVNNTPQVYVSAYPGTTVTMGSSITFSSVINNAGPGALYQWALNGVDVVGANTSTYTLPNVTTYDTVSLTVTSVMPCAVPNFKRATLIVHAHTVGVANVAASFENIALFPNPNNGSFSIKGDLAIQDAVSVEVLNIMGQPIYTDNITNPGTSLDKTIALDNAAAGIYLVRISQGGASKTLRFTVQH